MQLSSFWFFEWLGHLHPMIVHFPIGLLIGALILEIWSLSKKKEWNATGMVLLGMLSTLIATVFGLFLQNSGSYEGNLIDNHKWWSLGTLGLALITGLAYLRKDETTSRIPLLLLFLTSVTLAITGHLGASITHGVDYLTVDLPWTQGDYDQEETESILLGLRASSEEDSLSIEQLDDLNLQVRAIFAHNCYQCHSTAKRKGGLALDHKEGVFAGGDYGLAIVPTHAAESELIRRLKLPRSDEEAMPQKGKHLTSNEIALVEIWIDHGAHWADESLKVFREAELALSKPAIPKAPADITHPIDKFVNAYFEEKGIPWPKTIDDRKFIRRAYLDITGMLPKPQEMEAFLANSDTDKRSDLVDELLEDRQSYTLNWLTFWNDLLRNDYSGTGYITGGRKQITDWLYRSLLEGKPYNQMVAELVNPEPESAGFIKGIQWRGTVNSSQRTELQAAQNISQSLLGLNLKCASCHNSFINNLTLDDAYGFANIFATEPLEINRCDKPTGRMAKTAFLYPELGQVEADSLKERLKQLSEIMIKPENGRLYRTIVNRFWDRLLGRGLVAPVDEMDNFPWSQELLDWLSVHFMENDYDFRKLLATIMTSRTYQLQAVPYPSANYLTSESFVFKGPALRRLTAEQFIDAFSQSIAPVYYSVGYNPYHEALEAQWIWHREMEVDRINLPKPGKRLFRKTFAIDNLKELLAAEILITADDAFQLFLNEALTAEGDDWRKVHHLNIPLDRLDSRNIIAVGGSNEGQISNPAGLLFTLRLSYADSTFQFVNSDNTWKTTEDTIAQNWKGMAYDDNGWETAHRYGGFKNSYWGELLDYSFEAEHNTRSYARAALVKQDPFMKTIGRPARENVTTQRDVEFTLLQALTLTNSEFFSEKLERGAQTWFDRYGDDSSRLIEELYLHLLGRRPNKKEAKIILKQFREDPSPQQLEDIIWALVNLPEFQFM